MWELRLCGVERAVSNCFSLHVVKPCWETTHFFEKNAKKKSAFEDGEREGPPKALRRNSSLTRGKTQSIKDYSTVTKSLQKEPPFSEDQVFCCARGKAVGGPTDTINHRACTTKRLSQQEVALMIPSVFRRAKNLFDSSQLKDVWLSAGECWSEARVAHQVVGPE